MDVVPVLRPARRTEPLLLVGLAGLVAGVIVLVVAPRSWHSIAIARGGLATRALVLSCVFLALVGCSRGSIRSIGLSRWSS